jgi:hypothetical protein
LDSTGWKNTAAKACSECNAEIAPGYSHELIGPHEHVYTVQRVYDDDADCYAPSVFTTKEGQQAFWQEVKKSYGHEPQGEDEHGGTFCGHGGKCLADVNDEYAFCEDGHDWQLHTVPLLKMRHPDDPRGVH